MKDDTQSHQAFSELVALLADVDERWVSPEWNFHTVDDKVDAYRAVMHTLQWGLVGLFECDPSAPGFRRIANPSRKIMGDNPDAIYFDTPVSADYSYRVRGETRGAVYVSITIESGTDWGALENEVLSIINDDSFDIDDEGRFELFVGGKQRDRNWIGLPEGAGSLTTRHYFENPKSAGKDSALQPVMKIDVIDGAGEPPHRPTDSSVAEGIHRVNTLLRRITVGRPLSEQGRPIPWLSRVPNVFPPPGPPGTIGLAAFDAAYCMAPFMVGADEALVVKAAWPECRFGNVCLWNRHMQTLDYANRQTSLNRAQATADDDGNFTLVISATNPGTPNWLDTEGRRIGTVLFRFFLTHGELMTPTAQLLPLSEAAKHL